METSLFQPLSARVYVNLPEGKCIKWIHYPWLIWRTLKQSNMEAGRSTISEDFLPRCHQKLFIIFSLNFLCIHLSIYIYHIYISYIMYIYIYISCIYIYNIPYNYSPYFLGYTAIFRNMSVTVFFSFIFPVGGLGLHGGFWSWIRLINDDFELVGFSRRMIWWI